MPGSYTSLFNSFTIGQVVPEALPLSKDDIIEIYKPNGHYDQTLLNVKQASKQALYDEVAFNRLNDNPKELVAVIDLDDTFVHQHTAILSVNFRQDPTAISARILGKAAQPHPITQRIFRDYADAGVKIYALTGRNESERTPTEHTMQICRLDKCVSLTLKQDDDPRSIAEFKKEARQKIAAENQTRIFASFGDSDWDLDKDDCKHNFKMAEHYAYRSADLFKRVVKPDQNSAPTSNRPGPSTR